MAAGALFVDDRDRILLVHPTYKPYWDIPGGYVEHGESPLEACIREIEEELGLRVEMTDLLTVDWAPREDEGDKLLFIFDGGSLATSQLDGIHFGDGEIAEYAFVGEAELDQLTIPRLARRLRASLHARIGRHPVYLQHGTAPRRSHRG